MSNVSKGKRSAELGFTLIEVMVSAVILMLVFFGMAQVFSKSRTQLVHDEDRRTAVSVARARLESLREDYRRQDLHVLAGNDTTYVVDGTTYTVEHAVQSDVPEVLATTVTVTVNWDAMLNGTAEDRSLSYTTILGRSTQ